MDDTTRSSSRELLPELMRDMADHIAEGVIAEGIAPERAIQVAMSLVEQVIESWAGGYIYIPRGVQWRCSQRDQQIFAAAERGNIQQIAFEHNISVQRVYQILARVRATLAKQRQPDLFSPRN